MYCGSCLHDNTLAKELTRMGVNIQLVPTYTPIRTDEEDVSIDKVFFGGISVYLEERFPPFRWLPKSMVSWLDSPRMIHWVTSGGIKTNPHHLGAMTVSMLRGKHGRQRQEVDRLCHWMTHETRPQLINFSNALIAGCIPTLKQELGVPILITLQGDDLFLSGLPEPYQSQALAEIRQLMQYVDAFITFSTAYEQHIREYLGLTDKPAHIIPLGIDTSDFPKELPKLTTAEPITIAYLARIAPEKGLHVLIDAFLQLCQPPGSVDIRLQIAGWLGAEHQSYAQQQFRRLREAGLETKFDYQGTLDREQKIRFLKHTDIFCVPATFNEPKGLYVLEAMAAGVPVVQPDHGAFPEILASTEGGLLFRPGDSAHLAEILTELIQHPAKRMELALKGHSAVHKDLHSKNMADTTLAVYQQYLRS